MDRRRIFVKDMGLLHRRIIVIMIDQEVIVQVHHRDDAMDVEMKARRVSASLFEMFHRISRLKIYSKLLGGLANYGTCTFLVISIHNSQKVSLSLNIPRRKWPRKLEKK